ncbi:hypothetical protein L7F22_009456 [Adiantum nelumboides]|nr:hypothetical protein [Adiantum nelumboides]
MSRPTRRAHGSNISHYGASACGNGGSKQQSASACMKRPQRGLGVAELERIRLQEEQHEHHQQQHLLYLHNAKLQQCQPAYYMSSYCNSASAATTIAPPLPPSPQPHFPCIPHYSPCPSLPPNTLPQTNKPPCPPCTIPNPNYCNPLCLPICDTHTHNDASIATIAPTSTASTSAPPSDPSLPTFLPGPTSISNLYMIPISFDPSILPHAPNIHSHPHFLSTNYGDGLLDLHPNQQENSLFPVYPSSCHHSPTFQADENSIELKYSASVENEVELMHLTPWPSFPACPPDPCINKQFAYNPISEALASPALQKSMELELPSFQKQQDMDNKSKLTRRKCFLDLNLTQEDYEEVVSYDATKPPWKMKMISKDNMSFRVGSSRRDNFLKLGPPTTVETRDENEIHLNLHNNIMKSFEDHSKVVEQRLSHKHMVKETVVAKLDLSLKLSLPIA